MLILSCTSSNPIITHLLDNATLDFVLNNEIIFTFEKIEFLNDYLLDFFPNKKENSENPDNTDEIYENEKYR